MLILEENHDALVRILREARNVTGSEAAQVYLRCNRNCAGHCASTRTCKGRLLSLLHAVGDQYLGGGMA